jgi:putative heme iron utilization protein
MEPTSYLKINKNMKEVKFKIWYDDQLNDVVDKIASQLKSYGLEVIELDGGDGFMEYEIKPLK